MIQLSPTIYIIYRLYFYPSFVGFWLFYWLECWPEHRGAVAKKVRWLTQDQKIRTKKGVEIGLNVPIFSKLNHSYFCCNLLSIFILFYFTHEFPSQPGHRGGRYERYPKQASPQQAPLGKPSRPPRAWSPAWTTKERHPPEKGRGATQESVCSGTDTLTTKNQSQRANLPKIRPNNWEGTENIKDGGKRSKWVLQTQLQFLHNIKIILHSANLANIS